MLPEELYRGDNDKRIRLKNLKNRLLCTNLISGGNGQDIFKIPLIELVKMHINPGWKKTHFLSFSEKKEKAIKFGAHNFSGQPLIYSEEGDSWDFAIIEFNTKELQSTEIEKGVYECFYTPSYIEFGSRCEIRLINTVEYLIANPGLGTDIQVSNAKRDSEWLILPFNSILLNNNKTEYSAKLDMANVFNYELFEVGNL